MKNETTAVKKIISKRRSLDTIIEVANDEGYNTFKEGKIMAVAFPRDKSKGVRVEPRLDFEYTREGGLVAAFGLESDEEQVRDLFASGTMLRKAIKRRCKQYGLKKKTARRMIQFLDSLVA